MEELVSRVVHRRYSGSPKNIYEVRVFWPIQGKKMGLLPRQNLDKAYCNHLIWTEEYLTVKKSLKLILSLLIRRLKYISSPYKCWMGGGSEWVFKNYEDILLFTLKCQTQKIYIPHKYSNDTSILYFFTSILYCLIPKYKMACIWWLLLCCNSTLHAL